MDVHGASLLFPVETHGSVMVASRASELGLQSRRRTILSEHIKSCHANDLIVEKEISLLAAVGLVHNGSTVGPWRGPALATTCPDG